MNNHISQFFERHIGHSNLRGFILHFSVYFLRAQPVLNHHFRGHRTILDFLIARNRGYTQKLPRKAVVLTLAYEKIVFRYPQLEFRIIRDFRGFLRDRKLEHDAFVVAELFVIRASDVVLLRIMLWAQVAVVYVRVLEFVAPRAGFRCLFFNQKLIQ